MSLFAELKRRNVIRVGIAYIIVGWVIAQIAEFAFENFGAPDWVLKTVVVLLLLGLPLVLIFAWAFELTPEGIKREAEVDRSQSITPQTGHKLDRAIIVVLVIALAWFSHDKFSDTSESIPVVTEQVAAIDDTQNKSVAVLPFIAMSNGPDDEYFADGLTEEILNSLAQLPELLVTARTSAFSFKGQDIPVQEIASALGVNHIVEGSVRRSGDRLRVTAQLIRAEDGFHLWSNNYDSTATDTISVQENIAEQIASVMDVVLDDEKREAMRKAGLRDVEAFTLYQKGLELYARAHGEMDTIDGLRQANVYFEQVMERVPTFSQVYLDHSDLYVHALTDAASGLYSRSLTADEITNAYPIVIADYEAAKQHSRSASQNLHADLDLAYLSSNWRGLGGRIQRALNEPGCYTGNWPQIVAPTLGYADLYLDHALRVLECDPQSSQAWFNASRAALRTGDIEQSLRLAREGSEVAPGGWLFTELVRALIANGSYDEALVKIENHIRSNDLLLGFQALVFAAQGDRDGFARAFENFKNENDAGNYWLIMVAAWGGLRDEANRAAASVDQHRFGAATLSQLTQWCACGSPFDLEATPNFAARLEESGLPWPPEPVMEYPLKDW